ncbi:MAG: N-acetylmuramoyl-L-alanine amidase [Vampirovibrionales bacterium]
MPSETHLTLVYPQQGAEIHESQTFILGVASGKVSINGTPVLQSKAGYFAHTLPLQVGKNTVQIQCDTPEAIPETRTLTVYRSAPHRGEEGSHFDTQHHPLPNPCALLAGDTVPVHCYGTVGLQEVKARLLDVRFREVALAHLTPRTELGVCVDGEKHTLFYDTRDAIFAELHWTHPPIDASQLTCYEGSLTLPATWPQGLALNLDASLPLLLELEGKMLGQTVRWQPSLNLSGWMAPRIAITQCENAVMRSTPSDSGARLTPQSKGTPLLVTGIRGNYAQVQLSQGQTVGFPLAQLSTPQTGGLGHAKLQTINVQPRTCPFSGRETTHVHTPLPMKVPVEIEALDTHTLRVVLHRVHHACNFIHYLQAEASATATTAYTPPQLSIDRQSPEATVMLIHFPREEPPFVGWFHYWQADGLHLTLKHPPKAWQDTRIVLDAGHGGDETGAKGLNGVAEKHLTLAWSQQLESLLKERGFKHIIQTRTQDVDLSLGERQQAVFDADADISLSLHFNALPDGRNPWEAFGASSYFYFSQAQALAFALQQAMVHQGKRHDYGVLYDSLALTRLSHCQAVLLELGFLIHPLEFEELQTPDVQARLLTALADGLVRYCQTSSKSDALFRH